MSTLNRLARRTLALAAAGTAALLLTTAAPAMACGGLIGENGSIQLVRTTTLAAWHDGVEHYVTSFQFSGTGQSVGSIIPLPAVPTSVESAGQWTLQRLQREVAPQLERFAAADGAQLSSASSAVVLLTAQVDALDITVLQGGGDAVGRWALDNGFFLTPDAPEVLDFYAERSQIFLAAKFDAARAAAQGLSGGDGTPIHITMPTERPWVPLRILGLGLPADQRIAADVFLMTDEQPDLLTGTGVRVERSVPASESLMTDLRSDRNMEWMPQHLWLEHLVVDDTAGSLRYDLSAGTATTNPSPLAAGYPTDVPLVDTSASSDDGWRTVAIASLGSAVVLLAAAVALARRGRRASA